MAVFYNSYVTTKQDWLKSKKIIQLVQVGPGEKELAGVPNMRDLVTTDDQRRMLDFMEAPAYVGHGFFRPRRRAGRPRGSAQESVCRDGQRPGIPGRSEKAPDDRQSCHGGKDPVRHRHRHGDPGAVCSPSSARWSRSARRKPARRRSSARRKRTISGRVSMLRPDGLIHEQRRCTRHAYHRFPFPLVAQNVPGASRQARRATPASP